MLVPNQIIKTKVNASSIEHYRKKGYNVKMNHMAKVRAEDLTQSSNKQVEVMCDYCNQVIVKTYQKYFKQRNIVEKDACFDCFSVKQKEVCMVKYNVDTTLKLSHVQEQSSQTLMKKYGVDNPMKSPEVRETFKGTMLERYGVEYAQQSQEIRQKTVNTLINLYGVENPMDIKGMKRKCNNFEYVNSKKVSRAQKYIATQLDGDLNINVGGFFIDIMLDNNIAIEYDGSGHDLSVKFGSITKEDFQEREMRKYNSLIDSGYKYLVISNPKDKVINDEELTSIKNKIIYLQENNTSYAMLNIQ